MKHKLKFGGVVLAFSVISGVILSVLAIFSLILAPIGGAIDNHFADEELPLGIGIGLALVVVGLILILIAVLTFISGAKSRFKKGWNIYLIIIGILGTFTGVSIFYENKNLFILIAAIPFAFLSIFSILNMSFKKIIIVNQEPSFQNTFPQKQTNVNLSTIKTLESRIDELNDLLNRGYINDDEYNKLKEKAFEDYK